VLRSVARVSQPIGFMLQAFREDFKQSLKRVTEPPGFLFPDASSEKKIVFGSRFLSILITCPIHLNWAFITSVYMPKAWLRRGTSVLEIRSSHGIIMNWGITSTLFYCIISMSFQVNMSMLARYILQLLGSLALMFYLNAALTGVLIAVVPVVTLGAVQYGRYEYCINGRATSGAPSYRTALNLIPRF
jgi:hypothetical protein